MECPIILLECLSNAKCNECAIYKEYMLNDEDEHEYENDPFDCFYENDPFDCFDDDDLVAFVSFESFEKEFDEINIEDLPF